MKYKEMIKEGILEGNYDSFELMFATEFEEFYYENTDEVVPEGEPIGVVIDTENGIELVLFSNIYWNPQYDAVE